MDEQAGRETPKSEAFQALEKNLGKIGRLLELMTRSVGHIFAPSPEVIDKGRFLRREGRVSQSERICNAPIGGAATA